MNSCILQRAPAGLQGRKGWKSVRSVTRPPRRTRKICRVVAAIPTSSIAASNKSTAKSIQKAALITAIKTPYIETGIFDIEAFDSLVESQIQNGVEGLIIGGTTGEGHLMSWDEHIMLIAHCAIKFKGRILVIGNTGSNSTREAVHASMQGFNAGMDAALHINPYYGKTSYYGLRMHFKAALDKGPGIIYNVPSRTGQLVGEERE